MSRALAILSKDLRVLRRSPLLLALLAAYPLLVAVLVVVVAGYANARPRVALVDEDGLPARLELAGRAFDVAELIERVAAEVDLVRLSRAEADRQLETGRVVAALVVPRGFVADLRSLSRSPTLLLETTEGGLAPRVAQQVQALVFNLNRELQEAFVAANLRYVDVLRQGGRARFLGRDVELLGLARAQALLAQVPDRRLDEVRSFVQAARLALAQTDEALRVTAAPIRLREAPERGRAWGLSAQVQAYGLALAVTFVGLVLAAGALAAERDERVVARLARGLVSLGQLVAAKAALAATVALALGLVVALAFGVAVEAGDVPGGQPWERLPLLALGLVLAGASVGALGALLGALAQDGRTATLAAVLVALPVLLVGLVPRQLSPAAGYVSDALPFRHAAELFGAALYAPSPWREVGAEAAWLAGLGLAFGAAARAGARRLLA